MNVVMCTSALIHVFNIVLTFLKNPVGALGLDIIITAYDGGIRSSLGVDLHQNREESQQQWSYGPHDNTYTRTRKQSILTHNSHG